MMNMLYAAGFALLIGFGGGWQVRSWYDASTLAKCEARHAARDLADAKRDEAHRKSEADANRNAAANLAQRLKATKELTDERNRYLNSLSNDVACLIPGGLVRLHDAAAQAVHLPGSAGPPDATARPAACRAVIVTAAGNYDTCHDTADRLTDLQNWLRDIRRDGNR